MTIKPPPPGCQAFTLRTPREGEAHVFTLELIRQNMSEPKTIVAANERMLCFETLVNVAYLDLVGYASCEGVPTKLVACLYAIVVKFPHFCESDDVQRIISIVRKMGWDYAMLSSARTMIDRAVIASESRQPDILGYHLVESFAVRHLGYVRHLLDVHDIVMRAEREQQVETV